MAKSRAEYERRGFGFLCPSDAEFESGILTENGTRLKNDPLKIRTTSLFVRKLSGELNCALKTQCSALALFHRFGSALDIRPLEFMYVGAACLGIACKADENGLSMRAFVNGIRKIGLGQPVVDADSIDKVTAAEEAEFEKQRTHLIRCERIILNTLRYDIDTPYPHRILRDLMKAHSFHNGAQRELPIDQCACDILNDFLCAPAAVRYSPQMLCAAVVYVTFTLIDEDIASKESKKESKQTEAISGTQAYAAWNVHKRRAGEKAAEAPFCGFRAGDVVAAAEALMEVYKL